ncbi:MAG: hypothetical protein PUB47_08055 [Bacteroides sp.]|nr:hypothetical protein [Bacteroides sp.]
MLGIKENRVVVTGKFAAAVRKAAKDSADATCKHTSPKGDSNKSKYHFEWK